METEVPVINQPPCLMTYLPRKLRPKEEEEWQSTLVGHARLSKFEFLVGGKPRRFPP